MPERLRRPLGQGNQREGGRTRPRSRTRVGTTHSHPPLFGGVETSTSFRRSRSRIEWCTRLIDSRIFCAGTWWIVQRRQLNDGDRATHGLRGTQATKHYSRTLRIGVLPLCMMLHRGSCALRHRRHASPRSSSPVHSAAPRFTHRTYVI